MRLLVLSLASMLFLFGCKGEKGEKGDPGQTGVPAPNQPVVEQRTGTVGGGSIFLGTGAIPASSAVLVYLESSASVGTYVLLSIDATTGPWAEVSYPLGAVTFHNCAPTARYKVLIIEA